MIAWDEALRRRRGGVLLIDKPPGLSSHDVVNRARRLLGERRVGHCGTLDPLATGLLVLLVGECTRLSEAASAASKRYRCEALLGVTTDSDDITGTVLQRTPHLAVDAAQLASAIAKLTGEQQQVPPQFSAVHVAGQRAYRRARSGEAVELAARTVRVDTFTLLERSGDRLIFEALVSKGTYLRALVRDLGMLLGCGATMTALRRLAVDHLSVDQAANLEALGAADPWNALVSPAVLFPAEHQVPISEAQARDLRNGRVVRMERAAAASPGDGIVFAYSDCDVVGVLKYTNGVDFHLLRGFPV